MRMNEGRGDEWRWGYQGWEWEHKDWIANGEYTCELLPPGITLLFCMNHPLHMLKMKNVSFDPKNDYRTVCFFVISVNTTIMSPRWCKMTTMQFPFCVISLNTTMSVNTFVLSDVQRTSEPQISPLSLKKPKCGYVTLGQTRILWQPLYPIYIFASVTSVLTAEKWYRTKPQHFLNHHKVCILTQTIFP